MVLISVNTSIGLSPLCLSSSTLAFLRGSSIEGLVFFNSCEVVFKLSSAFFS